MNRVVHFEIHATNMDNAAEFYASVFGWKFTDMGPAMGNYRLIETGNMDSVGPDGKPWPGINGGLTPRRGPLPAGGEPVNAYVCTMDVDNLDSYIEKVKSAGGTMALEKMPIPGMGWLAYCKDPEGTIFGIMQSDPTAK